MLKKEEKSLEEIIRTLHQQQDNILSYGFKELKDKEKFETIINNTVIGATMFVVLIVLLHNVFPVLYRIFPPSSPAKLKDYKFHSYDYWIGIFFMVGFILITTIVKSLISHQSLKLYLDLYKEVQKFTETAQEQFDALTLEEQKKLVKKNLATADARNIVSLEFSCPISKALIIQPLVLKVQHPSHTDALEIYDEQAIRPELNKDKTFSPLSRQPIKQITFLEEINKKHLNFLVKLDKNLRKINSTNRQANEIITEDDTSTLRRRCI